MPFFPSLILYPTIILQITSILGSVTSRDPPNCAVTSCISNALQNIITRTFPGAMSVIKIIFMIQLATVVLYNYCEAVILLWSSLAYCGSAWLYHDRNFFTKVHISSFDFASYYFFR